MVDPKNNGIIIGGIVADPELVNDGKIAKFRLAVDYAGKDSVNPENKSGYFDVVMYQNDDQNSKFVFGQINDGKMKKGSQVGIVYRLSHQRWAGDEGNRQRIELTAEAITYIGGSGQAKEAGATEADAPSESAQAAVPQKF